MLPPMTLYTNEPDLVYFHTGHSSYIVFRVHRSGDWAAP